MTRTKVALEFFLPTGSFARINDAIEETRAVLTKHKGADFFITYSGPFPDDTRGSNDRQPEPDRSDLGRARGRSEGTAADDPEADTGAAEPAEPPKRRGRPPGSGKRGTEASGPPTGRSDEGERAEGRRSREGNRGHEPRGADEGTAKGRGEGEGRTRGTGADRGAERGDSEASRVAPADDWDDVPADDGPDANTEEGADWWCKTPGDEWPDHLMPAGALDKAVMGQILSQHFEQSGDRAKTLQVLKEATGESALPNVHPDDYDKAARALLKDAARIEHGVKR